MYKIVAMLHRMSHNLRCELVVSAVTKVKSLNLPSGGTSRRSVQGSSRCKPENVQLHNAVLHLGFWVGGDRSYYLKTSFAIKLTLF